MSGLVAARAPNVTRRTPVGSLPETPGPDHGMVATMTNRMWWAWQTVRSAAIAYRTGRRRAHD